jgi:septal ring factor EnvC (AmiA/AmiB activator)
MEEIRANVHQLVADDKKIMKLLNSISAELHEMHTDITDIDDRVAKLEASIIALEERDGQLGE